MSITKILSEFKTSNADKDYIEDLKSTVYHICRIQGKNKTEKILRNSNVSLYGKISSILYLKTINEEPFLEREARRVQYKNEKRARKSKHN